MTKTTDIADRMISEIEARTGETVPLLRRSFTRVVVKTFSGLFTLLYKYANWMVLQQYVQTASFSEVTVLGVTYQPLVMWGRLIGVGDPNAATAAELDITVTVLDQGGTLPAFTQLIYAPTGFVYTTTQATILDAPTVVVPVRAVSDPAGSGGVGASGNLADGSVLSFANAPAEVSATATVSGTTATAANAESEEDYRQRVLDRFQKRPEGGAYADYEAWALTVPGIRNAYPYTGLPGQVDVYCEATVASSGSADGIPTPAQLEAVLESVNLDENGVAYRRNASAWPNIYPITRTGFSVTVTGLTGVNDIATAQTDIEAAITEFLFDAEPYIPGLSVPPRLDQITRTRISAIVDDIARAAGGSFTSAIFTRDGDPSFIDAYVLGEGEKAKLSGIIFV